MFKIFLIVVLGYLGVCAYIFFSQQQLVYHPDRVLEATPERVSLEFEDVTFRAEDGIELHGWFVPADNHRGYALFCHGNGGNISHRLTTLQICNLLGLSTFLFDYRGYGASQGTPTEQGTHLDALAAWDWLRGTKGARPEEIVVWGRSLGGAVAARLAMEKRPRALILESTFTSVPDMGARKYPYLPVRLLSRFQYDTAGILDRIFCPVLVIHSPDDDIVPYAFGQALFDTARGEKRFLEIHGNHNAGFMDSGRTYQDGVGAFLDEVFKPPFQPEQQASSQEDTNNDTDVPADDQPKPETPQS